MTDLEIMVLDAIDLIGLGYVQLAAFRDLLEICALVQSAAEAGLPHGGIRFVSALLVFAFVHGPGLNMSQNHD